MTKALYAACAVLALSLAACNKEDVQRPADEQSVTQTEDNNFLKAESDQVNTDVQDALENFPTINGRVDADKIVCGCQIDSVAPRFVRLTYDGVTPCFTNPRRTRAGQIDVQLVQGSRWRDQGSVLSLTFRDFKVTRLGNTVANNRSVTFNGAKTLTNVRGTNWPAFLARTDSLVYRERGRDIQVTYHNGAQGTYSMARTTSWKVMRTTPRLDLTFRATGDTTLNGVPNTDSWGTGRFGNAYASAFTRPWVSNTYCGLAFPNAGQVVARSNGNTLTITLGVDQGGNPSTLDCAYGWKLDWLNAGGGSGSRVLSY